ncbi:YesL family protein [Niallia sp. JL1B1071]|uniref:YesL family protein n=1 Tax=Niallia tiangongensis TaxID=3237105 RepID=UPI0037DD99B7
MNGKWGGLYIVCEWIMKFSGANLLWVLFNIPIVILILNLFSASSINQVIISYIGIFILLPFVFFPATVALFAVVRKWIMKDESNKIIQVYVNHYRKNYLRSMSGGGLIILIWFVVAFYGYFLYLNRGISLFLLLPICILYVFTMNFFSINVHFEVKLLASLKHAIFITIGRPLITLEIACVSGLILYLSINIITFLIPFFIGSIIAFTAFLGFYSHLIKIDSKKKERKNIDLSHEISH